MSRTSIPADVKSPDRSLDIYFFVPRRSHSFLRLNLQQTTPEQQRRQDERELRVSGPKMNLRMLPNLQVRM